jgi:hypothetical protein
LAVFDGQAVVTSGTGKVRAKKGEQITLAEDKPAAGKFDVKATDPFYRWSARRAHYVAAANVTAARIAANSDYHAGFGGRSGWNWNPYFGMYTYVPANGVYWSPFGPAFYSPGMVGALYLPARPIWGSRNFPNGPGDGMRPGSPGLGMGGAPGMGAPPAMGGSPAGMGGMGGGGFPGGAGGAGGPTRPAGPSGN